MFLFFISTFIPLLKTLMTVVRIPCWIMFFHFTLQRLLAQGRGAARMSGRRSSLPLPCIYTLSNHCTPVNNKKDYLILFFQELLCSSSSSIRTIVRVFASTRTAWEKNGPQRLAAALDSTRTILVTSPRPARPPNLEHGKVQTRQARSHGSPDGLRQSMTHEALHTPNYSFGKSSSR